MDRVSTKPTTASTVRPANRNMVLSAIRDSGPLSRAELTRRLSLAKPTVAAIVEDLVDGGLVREVTGGRRPTAARPDAAARGPGRPPVLLAFDERSAFVLAIQVGSQQTTVVLANARGDEVARRRITTAGGAAEAALGEVGALAREVVVTSNIPRRRLAAAVVCVPGSVDAESGTCVLAPTLGWREVPVAGLIGAALGVPVVAHATVQAAAIGEVVAGAARGARTAVLVHAGTSIGAAIVEDGELFRGSAGLAGEIGHAVLPGLDAPCVCGRHGCVETAASAPAIARVARDAVRTGSPTRLSGLGDAITSLDVYAAAEAGDTLAQALLGEAGRTLGIAASWLVNIANPDVLVLAGGLVGSGAHFVEPFSAALEVHAAPAALGRLRVTTGSLGGEATIRGAVTLALRRAEASRA